MLKAILLFTYLAKFIIQITPLKDRIKILAHFRYKKRGEGLKGELRALAASLCAFPALSSQTKFQLFLFLSYYHEN